LPVLNKHLMYVLAKDAAILTVPTGTGVVADVVVLEALFGPVGTLVAKEVCVKEVVLTTTA
jgi:hypothetical protein